MMLKSKKLTKNREGIISTRNHKEQDRVPLDIGRINIIGVTLGAY